MTWLLACSLVAYGVAAGTTCERFGDSYEFRGTGVPGRLLSVALGLLWPLLWLAWPVSWLMGEKRTRRCDACGFEFVARYSWLISAGWILHARKSAACLDGETVGWWVKAAIRFHLTGQNVERHMARRKAALKARGPSVESP